MDDWIYYRFLLKLRSIIIAHNKWLPKTRSIPCCITSVFSAAVTDLVGHFFSFRCPLVSTPQLNTQLPNSLTMELLNSLTNDDSRIPSLFYLGANWRENTTSSSSSVIICFIRCYERRCLPMDYSASIRSRGNMCKFRGDSLPSNEPLRFSRVMPQYFDKKEARW
jgi:hypothetical protein